MKKKVKPNQIEKIDKMREVAKFLGISLDTFYTYQNRYWKKSKKGNRSMLLLYRLLIHLDLNEVQVFLDDRHFQKSLFLMDNQDILMGKSLSFDYREIV
ncbi:MAG: helix-turn-helix domain-containing protein [Campylobacter sp.]|nr:helix-turn-helix domain-containing protein [Campylobacter sp.]